MMYYKNHTPVNKVGHTSEFPFGIIDELWKTQKSEFWKDEKKNTGYIIILEMCTKNHNQGYSPWDTEWHNFLCHLGSFLPHAENQNFEKKKKGSGDVIILNLCSKKHNQMMYAYSDMEYDRHNFLSFRSFFALLPHY